MLSKLGGSFPYLAVVVNKDYKDEQSCGATDIITLSHYETGRVDVVAFPEGRMDDFKVFHQEESSEPMVTYAEVELSVFYAKQDGCHVVDLESGKILPE